MIAFVTAPPIDVIVSYRKTAGGADSLLLIFI